jgi:hypothetical protein
MYMKYKLCFLKSWTFIIWLNSTQQNYEKNQLKSIWIEFNQIQLNSNFNKNTNYFESKGKKIKINSIHFNFKN